MSTTAYALLEKLAVVTNASALPSSRLTLSFLRKEVVQEIESLDSTISKMLKAPIRALTLTNAMCFKSELSKKLEELDKLTRIVIDESLPIKEIDMQSEELAKTIKAKILTDSMLAQIKTARSTLARD